MHFANTYQLLKMGVVVLMTVFCGLSYSAVTISALTVVATAQPPDNFAWD